MREKRMCRAALDGDPDAAGVSAAGVRVLPGIYRAGLSGLSGGAQGAFQRRSGPEDRRPFGAGQPDRGAEKEDHQAVRR